jgi:hypothetical protein
MDESNSEFQNDIDTWSEITDHLFIWEYGRTYHLHDPGFYIPSSNIGNIQKDLQYLRNRNVSYIFVQNEEINPDPQPYNDDFHSFNPLRTWLYYQMMQDPDQNVEPLLKAFFEGYYGPAAEKMRQYLDYLEMRQQTYEGGLSLNDMGVVKFENGVRIGRKNYYKAYLDLNFFITADRLLREAEKLVAGDDYYRIRVIREFIPVYSALLHLQPLLQEAYCTKDAGFPFDRKDILTRYENIWDTYLDYPVNRTLKQKMAPFIQYRIDLLKKATGQTSEWNDPSLD